MQVERDGHALSERREWRRFLGVAALWLGVCLLGSGMVCWVAANWQEMGKFQRLAGVQGLVALAGAAAAVALWRRASASGPALLALAAVALGALLALVGQTYQTGADTWELFAWWTLLMLPWALAAGHWGVWLLWMLVLNLAVGLALGERVLPGWGVFFGQGWGLAAQAVLDAGLLGLWEAVGRRRGADLRWGPRALVAAIAAMVACGVMFADAPFGGLAGPAGLAWAGLTLALGAYYLYGRRDLLALALLAAAAMVVSLRVAGEWLVHQGADVWAALPLAMLLMVESACAVRWLRSLSRPSPVAGQGAGLARRAGGVSPEAGASAVPAPAAATPSPWYVQGLLGLGAWLSTLLLLLFVGASGLVSTEREALGWGLVLCVAAVVLARAGSAGLFRLQGAAAIGFAGQLLSLYGVFGIAGGAVAGLGTLVLAAAVYLLARERVLRFLSAWIMAAALTLWLGFGAGDAMEWLRFDAVSAFASWLPAMALLAWLAAGAFLLAGRAPTGASALSPLAWAFALASQAGAWQAAGASLPTLPALWALQPAASVVAVLAACLPVATAWAVTWPRQGALGPGLVLGLPLAMAALALFWLPSPGVSFALAWIILGQGQARPGLVRFGALALLAYLAGYYHQQEVPLLEKAVWLCAAGAVLLACGALVRGLPRPAGTSAGLAAAGPGRRPWRAGLALAGLVLALACANVAIRRYETVLAQGRTVLLALAPVDPRSLMQGDYMALRFAVAGDLLGRLARQAGSPGAAPNGDGYLILAPDARGVAALARIQPGPEPRAAGEIALRYRVREGQARIVTNAFFFPEGQAARYQAARFGELRVDDSGTGLLTALRDADLDPL